MSGHNKWSSIKHKKGKMDAQRGKIFSKLIREITVAARTGGGDLASNPRLRQAIAAAKAENMPMDNIQKAILRGTGELPGTSYEEAHYEGFSSSGVAIMLTALTDNRNRTTSEIRHIFSRHGGNLGESGCASHCFQKKGYIIVPKKDVKEEEVMEIVLNSGGEDMEEVGDTFEIFAPPENFEDVKKALEEAKIPIISAEISMIPNVYVQIDSKEGEKIMKLLEALEEHDDVQKVWANAEFIGTE